MAELLPESQQYTHDEQMTEYDIGICGNNPMKEDRRFIQDARYMYEKAIFEEQPSEPTASDLERFTRRNTPAPDNLPELPEDNPRGSAKKSLLENLQTENRESCVSTKSKICR